MIRLATLEREVDVTIGDETFSEVQGVGHVVRSWPIMIPIDGVLVENTEKVREGIAMFLDFKHYIWLAPLNEYDPSTNSHDPSADERWEVQ